MSEHKGYKGKIHDFLISNKIEVGDLVKVTSELTYSGILMPRYESGDENKTVQTQQTRVTKLKCSQQWPPHHTTQLSYSSHVFPTIYHGVLNGKTK